MPRSTSWPNSAPMPVKGRATPTFTSCASATPAIRESAASSAKIRLVMGSPLGGPDAELEGSELEARPDALDGLLGLVAAAEAGEAEVALAARAEAGARGADDVRL